MTGNGRFLLGLACGTVLAMLPRAATHLRAATRALDGSAGTHGSGRVHTEEKFVFTARAPMEQVAPLFGANKERAWAPGWVPDFVYPSPAADVQGMVFTVPHDQLQSAWVNTVFDLQKGHIQYTYVIPEHLVTVITVSLQRQGQQTGVEVHYDRTSLTAGGDEHVRTMAQHDRDSGPEWERQINEYLEKHPGS